MPLFSGSVQFALEPLDAQIVFAHPSEAAHVARAMEKRRREFATGRRIAHTLLARIGVEDTPLLPPEGSRAPAWPRGVVGSISHTTALCGVAIAKAEERWGLGLDVEHDAGLDEKLWARILRADEQRRLPAGREEACAKVVFSAKECAYKTLSPALGRVLEFHEMELEVPFAEMGSEPVAWRARLLADDTPVACGFELEGLVRLADGHVQSACELSAAPA